MTASIATVPATPRASAHRLLGTVGVLGAPAFLAQWIAARLTGVDVQASQTTATTLLGAAYLVGWACSAVGLRRMRATGRGTGAAAIFAVQCVGLLLAMAQQLQDLVGRHPLGEAFYRACDLAWPLGHLFMLVVGAAVVRTGAWTGWRRWTPLACGVALPVALAAAALGRPAMEAAFAFGTTAAFGALGLAVLATPDADA